jgi:hypothetical protein
MEIHRHRQAVSEGAYQLVSPHCWGRRPLFKVPSGRNMPLGIDPGAAPSSRSFWFKLADGEVAHPETVTPAIPNAAMASATAFTLLLPTTTHAPISLEQV